MSLSSVYTVDELYTSRYTMQHIIQAMIPITWLDELVQYCGEKLHLILSRGVVEAKRE